MKDATATSGPARELLWRLVRPAALLVTIVSGVLVAGVWIPPDFGSPDWEFGTIHGFLDGLPLFLVGLGLLAAAALAEGRQATSSVIGVTFVVIAIAVVLAGLLMAINLPLAWRASSANPGLHAAVKKGMAKAAVQVGVMSLGCLLMAVKCLRRDRVAARS